MKPRVLIFEDNDTIRLTLKYILYQRGYEVFTFPDPAMYQVFNSVIHDCRLDHACADIIISEVNMPTESGLEFIKNQKEKGCKIKYRALMSGDWTDSDLQTAQELGCRVFHKPFVSEMLLWLDDCRKRIKPERKLSNLLSN
jgi:DNA-binding response OmpR family regulator